MDKKNLILGVLLLLAGMGLMFYYQTQTAAFQKEQAQVQAEQVAEDDTVAAGETDDSEASADRPARDADATVRAENETAQYPERTPAPEPEQDYAFQATEQTLVLENEVIRAEVSTFGGGIQTITLKDYPDENPARVENPDPVILNEGGKYAIMALTHQSGEKFGADVARYYDVVEQSPTRLVLEGQVDAGLKIRRTYELNPGDDGAAPYVVHHKLEYINTTDTPRPLGTQFLHIGTSAPTAADQRGQNLKASYYDSDNDYHTISSAKFRSGGKLPFTSSDPENRVERRTPIIWGAVKNQFFTMIATPSHPASGLVAVPRRFMVDTMTGQEPVGVAAALEFVLPNLEPQGTYDLDVELYAGPKDYSHLEELDPDQDEVLELGWFVGLSVGLIAFISKGMLKLLEFYQGFLGSWGFAIIFATLTIRLILLPLTAKSARSSKRMQELQGPLKEIREKYADDPVQLNQEMAKLWKKHGVNPLSGCWPILIQFPIFIAFFNLLRNASELRYADFLWISDLSMPDQTIHFGTMMPLVGDSLNILPFFWLVSMILLMKFTPQPAAAADNPAMKVMKYMPIIFFFFTYQFSSGLVLYWTTTNTFSIFQGWYIHRHKDKEDQIIEAEVAEVESHKKQEPLIKKKKKKDEPEQPRLPWQKK
ncbi:MAG: preprotein translocase subunit YidC [Puniceicoccaceae bacterium 5H]|nr:MAG: preprotein translocase subunit YidC [Puniceicoccaceae bacterium 5H]